TLSHPFLTIDGWRPLAELRTGVRIAVPRRLDVFGQESLRECEVKLLAYLIGDGCLTNGLPKFTNGDPRIRADFREAAAAFGAVKVREDSHRNPWLATRTSLPRPGRSSPHACKRPSRPAPARPALWLWHWALVRRHCVFGAREPVCPAGKPSTDSVRSWRSNRRNWRRTATP